MKHLRQLSMIIVIIVLLSALISCKPANQSSVPEDQDSAAAEQSTPEKQTSTEQTSVPSKLGLLYNGFCVQEDWIYYTDDKNMLCKVNTNGGEKTKICDDLIRWFQIYEDRIYYIILSDVSYIYSINMDGSDKAIVSDKILGGDSAKKLFIADGWIYFIDTYELFKIKTDGTELTSITSPCQDISVSGEWIYYFVPDLLFDKECYLYRIRLDGTDKTCFTEESVSCADFDGTWIYYGAADHSGIYKIKYDGSEKKQLSSDISDLQLKVVDDWLYYTVSQEGIYKVRTDGSEIVQVSEDSLATFSDIWENYLLYTNFNIEEGVPSMTTCSITLDESAETNKVVAEIIESVIAGKNDMVTFKKYK